MLLQSVRNLDRDSEPGGDNLSGLNGLGFHTRPNDPWTEPLQPGSEELGPMTTDITKSPCGSGPVALDLRQ